MNFGKRDRVLVPTTMFWSFSCVNCLFAVLTHGGSMVLQFKFDAREAADRADRREEPAFEVHDRPGSRPIAYYFSGEVGGRAGGPSSSPAGSIMRWASESPG